jgi:hypothetical protein
MELQSWRWLRHDGAAVEVELKMGILLRICLGGGGGGTAELQSSLLVEEFLSTRKILFSRCSIEAAAATTGDVGIPP